MSLIQKFPDSNFARPTRNYGSNTEESKGEPAMMGYVEFPFPKAMPATTNAEVTITYNMDFTNAQQGTSVNTYEHQANAINAESGMKMTPYGQSPPEYSSAESDKNENVSEASEDKESGE
jgi:hypothetical protein